MSLKSSLSLKNPLRVLYHLLRGISANIYYGNPAKGMIVIGVTGTKGKSSTCNLIARGLEAAGKNVCMFSTVNMDISGEWSENPYKMTSPDPFIIQSFLAKARASKCEYAVLEVSSHALFYNRFYGVDFDVAVFTNLSQDHLDLHGTMDEYAKTKLQLFTGLAYSERKKGVRKVGIVNIDDSYSRDFLDATVDSMYTFGKNPSAQIQPINIQQSESGMTFQAKMPAHTIDIHTSLIGEFNIYNILAATAVLVSQKISPEAISTAIDTVHGIDGRMQEIPTDLGCKIFVDYAHTEESLRQVLTTLQTIRKEDQKIILVFGATGDRDKDKRPKMGAVADEFADLIILTEDDSYSEDQFSIMNQVTQGIKRREGENFWIIFHREDAIRTALLSAKKGDIVLLAGKGSEKVIVRNTGSEPWSDAMVVRTIAQEIEMNRLQ